MTLREHLHKIRKTVARVWGYFPLSGPGLLLLTAAGLLRWYYVDQRQDYVLLIVSSGVFVLLGFALLQLLAVVAYFFRDLKDQRLLQISGSTLEPFFTGFSLRKPFYTPSVQVAITWQEPVASQTRLLPRNGRLQESVILARRASESAVTRTVIFQDAFGLVKFRHTFKLPQKTWVTPKPGGLPNYDTLRLFAAGDEISHPEGQPVGDLIEMKPYVAGDPIKRILWRTYAKSRRLLVRMPERAIARKKKTFAYLVTGASDEAAAATAWLALDKGLLGQEFLFATDGVGAATPHRQEAFDHIVSSSNADRHGEHLEGFFTDQPDANKANCVVFAPPEDGPWVQRLETLAGRFARNLNIFIATRDWRAHTRPKGWQRWILNDPADVAGDALRAKELFNRLSQLGYRVTVIDQLRGAIVPEFELREAA